MELGDKIAVLERGKVAQLATPSMLYSQPASRYVATFVGSANEIAGTVESVSADGAVLDTVLGRVVGARVALDVEVGGPAVAIFRPERGRVSATRPDGVNSWPVVYRNELFSGTHAEHVVTHDHIAYRIWADGSAVPAAGNAAWMTVAPADLHIFKP